MKPITVFNAVLVLGMLLALPACSKRDEAAPGPAEQAGRAIDKAVDNAGDKVARELQVSKEAAEKAAREVADAARQSGEQINQATEEASEGLSDATRQVGKKVERAGEKIQDAARPKPGG